jgi:translation initiation factor IF-2
LVPEEFGGDVLCVEVSAKTGDGIDTLLESIALQSEMLELKADANRPGAGVVLEGELDKSRGPVASILVQSGTVKKGNYLVAGTACGRIRDVRDENGKPVKEAGPSCPVEVLGLSSVPEAGQAFNIVENERAAKELVAYREGEIKKKSELSTRPVVSLEAFFAQAEGLGPKELNIVLKADVQGSVEALRDSLEKLSTEKVGVRVLHSGVGGITESDVMLAAASEAIIVGFAVRPDVPARRAADSNGVDVRTYKVIYEALDEVRTAMAGLLAPTRHEVSQGRAEIREVFVIPKVGAIAGCQLSDGFVKRNSLCRVVRDGVVVYESKVSSLRRFKDDVSEVKQGMECGIGVENFNDLKVGDVIEAFEMEERVATLE